MADNVAITPGSGATIATDDVGGVQYQRVKVDIGGDGAASPLVRGQQAKANSLPVALASDQDALPVTDNGSSLTVDDGAGSLTVDNAALESLVLAEDAVHGSGDKGIMALAVRNDSGTVLSGADGDYTPLSTNNSGALRTVVGGFAAHDAAVAGNPLLAAGFASAAAPADVSADGDTVRAWMLRNGAQASVLTAAGALIGGDATNGLDVDVTRLPALAPGSNNIGDVDILSIAAGDNNIGNVDIVTLPNVTLAAGTNTNEVVGDAAHGATVAGNPVLSGREARTSDGTAVSSGQAVRAIADTLGKQVVLIGSVSDLHSNGKGTFSNTTAADLIAAAGAGVRIAVTSILVTNASASVGTKVEIRDGTTVKAQGYAAPAGGGFALNAGGAPLFIGTANTAVTGRCVTTGADVDIVVSGYKIGN